MPETWDYTLHIPNDPRAVTICRRTLRLMLTMHGLTGLVDTAELLATELVRMPHCTRRGPPRSGCGGRRRAWCGSGRGTSDPEPPEPPRPLERVGEQEGGRGLGLVAACTKYWGWMPSARSQPGQVRVVRAGGGVGPS